MAVISEIELQAVDEFLVAPKRLEGDPPQWLQSQRPDDVLANWNIVDHLGVVSGQMRFRLSKLAPEYPSVSLIFRGNAVWRVDLCPPDVQKFNPPWAIALRLPASFNGSHCHTWADNRDHIGRTGIWKLDARRPVEIALRRVRQMLPWIADRVGIELTAAQRQFDAPPRSDLFERY
jgi:hypothetical protein